MIPAPPPGIFPTSAPSSPANPPTSFEAVPDHREAGAHREACASHGAVVLIHMEICQEESGVESSGSPVDQPGLLGNMPFSYGLQVPSCLISSLQSLHANTKGNTSAAENEETKINTTGHGKGKASS